MIEIRTGHALDLLREMPAGSVQCCLTSPPYWGLRDYGDPGKEWPEVTFSPMPGLPSMTVPASCEPLGLESDPWAYVGHIVALFREVRRVLRDDGVLFLNLGDSYAGSYGNQGRKEGRGSQRPVNGPMLQRFHAEQETHALDCDMDEDCTRGTIGRTQYPQKQTGTGAIPKGSGLKPKDLVGIPWRAAFALQADGWYLRSDVIWAKPNPMPESVTDRPTKAHEYVFLLTKSARYFWDLEAVREPVKATSGVINGAPTLGAHRLIEGASRTERREYGRICGANARTVWTIPTQPYPGAHFAVWPPELAARCIKAGSRKGDTVLDPFGGSGTTGLVAREHGRSAILLEQSSTYADMARRRLGQPPEDLDAAQAAVRALPLFRGGT